MVRTRKDLSKKELAVLDDLQKLKKQLDPETAEAIFSLIGSAIDLWRA
jgi:hypothetical protein